MYWFSKVLHDLSVDYEFIDELLNQDYDRMIGLLPYGSNCTLAGINVPQTLTYFFLF